MPALALPHQRIDFAVECIIFFRSQFIRGIELMPNAAIAIACICLLTLSGCGNTAYGLKKDGQQTSHALDNATHRVLSAGAKK